MTIIGGTIINWNNAGRLNRVCCKACRGGVRAENRESHRKRRSQLFRSSGNRYLVVC